MWGKKITAIYYMYLKIIVYPFIQVFSHHLPSHVMLGISMTAHCWGSELPTLTRKSRKEPFPACELASQVSTVCQQVFEFSLCCSSYRLALSLTTFFPCRGQILCSLGDHLTPQLPTCLPIFLDRLRNEITRLTTVKAYTLIAGWELNYSNLHVGSNKQKTQKDIPFFPGPLSVNPTLKGKRLGNP